MNIDMVQRDQDRRLLTGILQRTSDVIAGRVSERMSAEQPAQLAQPDEEPAPPAEDVPDVDAADRPDDGHSHNTGGSLAWGGHANGRIPAKELEVIGQGSHRLWSPAAQAWRAMREAAAAEGIALTLTDSYRTYDAQVRLRRERGHLVATATPGTSVHGWGRAVDANVKDPKVLAWLRANGPRFGWVNPDWAQRAGKSYEPWHWEFRGEG